MNNLLGPWVRRFLVEYVMGERNYSPNTQHSYRDTFRLFLPLAAKQCRCTVENLTVNGIKPKLLREFTNTGARASELSRLTVEDLDLVIPMATLHGKGRKIRQCPLWKVTAEALREVVGNRSAHQGVFLNRHGESLTRYGVHILVKR